MLTLPTHIQDITFSDIKVMLEVIDMQLSKHFYGFPDDYKGLPREELVKMRKYLHEIALDKTIDMIKRMQAAE